MCIISHSAWYTLDVCECELFFLHLFFRFFLCLGRDEYHSRNYFSPNSEEMACMYICCFLLLRVNSYHWLFSSFLIVSVFFPSYFLAVFLSFALLSTNSWFVAVLGIRWRRPIAADWPRTIRSWWWWSWSWIHPLRNWWSSWRTFSCPRRSSWLRRRCRSSESCRWLKTHRSQKACES